MLWLVSTLGHYVSSIVCAPPLDTKCYIEFYMWNILTSQQFTKKFQLFSPWLCWKLRETIHCHNMLAGRGHFELHSIRRRALYLKTLHIIIQFSYTQTLYVHYRTNWNNNIRNGFMRYSPLGTHYMTYIYFLFLTSSCFVYI